MPTSDEPRRADRAFEQGDMLTAKRLYEQSVRSGPQGYAEYARYKLAWVHINLDEHQAALEQLVWVATRAARPELRRAAAQDLVFPYLHVGRPARALPFFERIDRARAFTLLRQLADRYLDAGQHEDARVVLRIAAAGDPDATRVCQAHIELVRIATMSDPRADVLTEADRLSRKAPLGDDACRAAAEDLVTSLARAWQHELPKSNLPRADVIRMWDHAAALASTAAGRAAAARERANLGGP